MQGEAIDYFGLLLYGELRIGKNSELTEKQIKNGEKIYKLKIGDMIGY